MAMHKTEHDSLGLEARHDLGLGLQTLENSNKRVIYSSLMYGRLFLFVIVITS